MCHLTLMAIDPGSSNLGVALYTIDSTDGSIVATHAYTITANKSKFYSKELSKKMGDRFARLHAMRCEITDALNQHRPMMAACESPFYNPRMPNAYGVLVECVYMIQMAVWDYNDRVGFIRVAPKEAKMAVGAKKNGKDEVQKQVKKMLDTFKLDVTFSSLDEHAVDAIAIGYHAYLRHFKLEQTR